LQELMKKQELIEKNLKTIDEGGEKARKGDDAVSKEIRELEKKLEAADTVEEIQELEKKIRELKE